MEYLKTLDYNPLRQSVSLIGATQTGKTTHAISMCKMLQVNGFNILILDNKRRFTSLDPNAVIHTLSDIRGQGLEILQPMTFSNPNQMLQFFSDLSYVMYRLHNQIFVVDELHSWFKDPRSHVMGFEMYCRECHNQNSSFIAIFQAPSEVPKYVLRNSHHRFLLHLDIDKDIDFMKSYIGKEAIDFSKGEIKQYEGIYKEQGKPCKLFKVVKID